MMKAALRTLRNRAAVILVVTTLLVPMAALPAHAADSATFTMTPSAVVGESTVDFTLTFTSQLAALNGNPSTLTIDFDPALPAPQLGNSGNPGFIDTGGISTSCNSYVLTHDNNAAPRRLTLDLQCGDGKSISIPYKNVTVPATADAPANPFVLSLQGPPGVVITFPSTVSWLVDDGPNPPTLDSAVGGDGVVDLEWDAPASGSVTGYKVERSETDDTTGFSAVGSVLSDSTLSLADTSVTNGTTYWYRIRTVNGVGESDPSDVKEATPQTAPGDPNLTTADAGDGQVDLAWTAPSGAVTSYRLERAEEDLATPGTPGAFSTLAGSLTALSHTDTTAANGTKYWYRVVALNGTSAGSPSNVMAATPQIAAPGAPDLTGAAAGNGEVALTWAPTTGGAVATYTVERAVHTGSTVGAFSDLVTGLTGLTHTDTSAVNGTTYSYRVVATNATGSATSNVRSATPQAPGGNNNNDNDNGGGGGGPITVPTPPETPPETPPITPPAPGRCVDEAPPSNFSDVPAGHMHERSIDCIAWKNITAGTTPRTFSPGRVTTRAQMASFLTRTIREAGVGLPAGRNMFTDDERSVHQHAINQLAAAGVVVGKAPGRFDPGAPIRRDQMATMLVQTYAYIRDEQVEAGRDHFIDDNGNVHEANINAAADLALTFGRTPGRYEPASGTRRDQMAAFITRLLELLG